MAHQPILRPDDSEKPESKDSFVREPVNHEITYPFIELTRTFAAHGAGVISADLALDLILNDIVEQACIATGAKGAAIALVRGDEMVCRASSGTDAPGLGVRLEIRSGLSGACVQERAQQLCVDAETDPRVDAEACRQTGIRSILVLPLMEGEEVFGILEIFSSHPNAFGELDTITLKALAQQVVANRRQAHDTTGKLETGSIDLPRVVTGIESNLEPGARPNDSAHAYEISSPNMPLAAGTRGANGGGKRPSPPIDFWTAFLAVLVIGAAVLMGTLVGWRFGSVRAAVPRHGTARRNSETETKAETTTTAASTTPKTTTPSATPASASPETGSTPRKNSVPVAPRNPASRQSVTARNRAPAEPPVGGLVVYEKGRLIYRMPPSSPAVASAGQHEARSNQDAVILAGQISPDAKPVAEQVAAARLVHRVEPQYPAGAEQRRIQGPVVLEAEISREGAVQKLSVVKGDPILAASALQAVKQWRYQPYTLDGRPVGMLTTITVNFTLPAVQNH